MTIHRKPSTKPAAAAAAAFIGAAPDAAAPAQQQQEQVLDAAGVVKQFTLKMTVADLATVDAAAKRRRMSRAAFIRMAVFKEIEGD